jgi:hypothetical protein
MVMSPIPKPNLALLQRLRSIGMMEGRIYPQLRHQRLTRPHQPPQRPKRTPKSMFFGPVSGSPVRMPQRATPNRNKSSMR